MSNQGVFGCDYCDTALGRQGCPIHRDWTVPVLDPTIQVTPYETNEQARITRLEQVQRRLAGLATERYERILVLERAKAELGGEVAKLKAELNRVEAENTDLALETAEAVRTRNLAQEASSRDALEKQRLRADLAELTHYAEEVKEAIEPSAHSGEWIPSAIKRIASAKNRVRALEAMAALVRREHDSRGEQFVPPVDGLFCCRTHQCTGEQHDKDCPHRKANL